MSINKRLVTHIWLNRHINKINNMYCNIGELKACILQITTHLIQKLNKINKNKTIISEDLSLLF